MVDTERRELAVFYRVYWFLLVPLFNVFWRIGVTGRENARRRGGMILASNHSSGADPLVVCSSFWRQIFWLAKVEYVVTPKVAWFFRSISVIPVDRDAPAEASFEAAAACVRRGRIFGIYPEGTRSPDGRLYRGHTGVARIAEMTGAPVIPTGVVGALQSLPRGKLLPRPTKINVLFGEPLYFERLPGEDDKVAYRRFTDDVMHAIAKLTGQEHVEDQYSRDARHERAEAEG